MLLSRLHRIPETLGALIEEGSYYSQIVFNVDQTGLFWKKISKRTFIARDCKLKPLLVYCTESPSLKK